MTISRALTARGPLTVLAALTLAVALPGAAAAGSAGAIGGRHVVAVGTPVAARETSAVVRFGEDVTVERGEAQDSVVVFGGDVRVDGTVQQVVAVFGGDVVVSGEVGETLFIAGGDGRLASTAVVGSRQSGSDPSIVLLGGDLTRQPGATVVGDVQRAQSIHVGSAVDWASTHALVRPWWGLSVVGLLVQTAVFLVLALVAAALMPGQLGAVQRQLSRRPAASLGWGALVVLVAAPVTLVILIVSIVGLLLVIPYGVLLLLAYFFAVTAVAAFVAGRLLAGGSHKDNLMLAVTLGVVATTLASRIPVAGPLLLLAMTLFGVGAGSLAVLEWRRAAKAATVAGDEGSPGPQAQP